MICRRQACGDSERRCGRRSTVEFIDARAAGIRAICGTRGGARLEPLIPPARPGGRPRKTDMRAAMNAILYLLRNRLPLALWRTKPLRGWKRGPVFSERRDKVRLFWFPTLSTTFTSLPVDRRVRRISVGGL